MRSPLPMLLMVIRALSQKARLADPAIDELLLSALSRWQNKMVLSDWQNPCAGNEISFNKSTLFSGKFVSFHWSSPEKQDSEKLFHRSLWELYFYFFVIDFQISTFAFGASFATAPKIPIDNCRRPKQDRKPKLDPDGGIISNNKFFPAFPASFNWYIYFHFALWYILILL